MRETVARYRIALAALRIVLDQEYDVLRESRRLRDVCDALARDRPPAGILEERAALLERVECDLARVSDAAQRLEWCLARCREPAVPSC